MSKKYRIAELVVGMNSFGKTEKRAASYLYKSNSMPDITVWAERKESAKKKFPYISEELAEYLATGLNFYDQLIRYNGFMLHASAVVVNEKAYLFSANSGTGKSTHTKLWLDYFGEDAYILNDDKPALRLMGGKWYAFGTPWSGKNDISVNKGVELAGIAMVKRSENNSIELYSGKYAIFDIFFQTNRPKDYESREKLMFLIDKLVTDIPIWKLNCNMDIEAVEVAYNAMCVADEEN